MQRKSLLVNGRTCPLCIACPAHRRHCWLVAAYVLSRTFFGGFVVMAAAYTGNREGTNSTNVNTTAKDRVAELKSKKRANFICLLC